MATAQTAGTASIQGTVTDPSGAAISNATVTITDEATGVKSATTTGSSGLYSFPNIHIGNYRLEVTATGFQRYQQSGIVLDVGSSIAINPAMKVGQQNVTVQVTSQNLALQTEDSTLKQTVDTRTMTEMPLNGRQMTDLVKAQGGAINANENNDEAGSKNFWSSQVISITGGQGNATDYRLDGADWNDYMTNVNLPFPFPDAVSEFTVETTAQGAQSGLHPGGLVNVVTRSGSNQWHGDAFEFIRNNYIDASNFFSATKDTLHQDQFGGTLGGKIITNKLFFFGGYQRLRAVAQGSFHNVTVPTQAELNGCWSQTYVVNPFTGAPLTPNAAACASYGASDLYVNPATYSKAALALASYLPPASNQSTGAETYTMPTEQFENIYITREDWTINQKHSLYARFEWDGFDGPAFFDPKDILVTTSPGNQEHVDGVVLGETWIVRNNLVNSLRASVDRRVDDRGPNAAGFNANKLGVNIYSLNGVGFPLSVASGASGFSTYCGTCALAVFNVNTFELSDDVNWVKGKHQIQFGGSYARSQFNSSNVFQGNGNFTFAGNYSVLGPSGSGSIPKGESAVPMLDFLMGAMSQFQESKPQQNALRAPIPNLYFEETYHMSSRVVLTAGVRWDPEYFPTDYFGRGSVFNYNNFVNNVQSAVYVNAPPGSLFFGDPGVRKNFTENSPWQFSPRVGATWDPTGNGKTVFRIGAGLVYDEPNFFSAERQQDNPPFGLQITNSPNGTPLSFDSPWSSGTTTPNPFPQPAEPTKNAAFLKNGQYQFILLPKQFHSPYMIQWTLSAQRELGHGWQVQVDYIGNHTVHGAYGFPINTATYIPGNWGAAGTGCPGFVVGPGKVGAAGTACSTTSNYAGRFALTQANSTWGPAYGGGGGGTLIVQDGSNSNYDGMIATLQHRLSSNFVLLANYTWSHCIDINDDTADVSGTQAEDPFNIGLDKGGCGFDFRHVFNTTVVASSHFHFNPLWNQVVNNWEISPLIHATDGSPFNVTSGIDNSLLDVSNDRPNLISSSVYTHQKILRASPQYINKSAFAENAPGTFGNVRRFAFRGPKYFELDAALNRSFPLHERLALDLRLESFNLLNHPNFAAPGSTGYLGSNTGLNASTFGQITSTLNNSQLPARLFQGAIKFSF